MTTALSRLLALGGLAGRVGASLIASKLGEVGRNADGRSSRRTALFVRNATRAVETLGRMKGAAMKVGQMLSLHAELLPPEVVDVLRSLQRSAPKVPAEVMEFEARGELKDFDRLFSRFDRDAMASASIGQVHRATLHDGRDVVVKIQYPMIDEIVRADLSNLKTVLHGLFALFSDAEFEPLWLEVRDRMLEELDYEREAATIRTMAALHAAVPEVILPRVVDEASTRRVLTMECCPGIPPEHACAGAFPQPLRDRWGATLFAFFFRGLFEHRLLHADPNFSNFAFREDGSIVVYDHGCMKEVPESLARGYARLVLAVLEDRGGDIPGLLLEMGVGFEDGRPVGAELTQPYADVLGQIMRADPPFRFGEETGIVRRLFELGTEHASDAIDLRFPRDVVFVNRTLSGHVGNLARLHASGPWRELALRYVVPAAG